MTPRDLIAAELAAAGISVSEEELDELAAGYAQRRAGLDRLYAVEGVRDEEAAITFSAVVDDS